MVRRGLGGCVVLLLAYGVDVNRGSPEGDTALHAAARAGRSEMVRAEPPLLYYYTTNILLYFYYNTIRSEIVHAAPLLLLHY